LRVLLMDAGDHNQLVVIALLDDRRTTPALEPRTDDRNSHFRALFTG
jgi:hypothetical protein